jgi:hypothetical protein
MRMSRTELAMQYFIDYGGATNGSRAMLARIPIGLYSEFKSLFGNKFRLRYRGPRAHRVVQGRSHSLAQSTCLKVDATHFSAYMQ